MTRLAVFAYSDTGHACLEHLLQRGERIAFLATHRDHPEEARWFPSVAELARAHGIEPLIMLHSTFRIYPLESLIGICIFSPNQT